MRSRPPAPPAIARAITLAITLTSGLASAAAAPDTAPVIDGYTVNSFPSDLAGALFPGESLHPPSLPAMWPRLSIPALSTAQVDQAVRGNTIRLNDHVAVYFDPAGRIEAWLNEWAAADSPKRCSQPEIAGDDFRIEDGECKRKSIVPVTGEWQARNNSLCVVLRMPNETESECWYVALVTDQVALFDETGDMLGRMKVLRRGRVLAQIAD